MSCVWDGYMEFGAGADAGACTMKGVCSEIEHAETILEVGNFNENFSKCSRCS